jgi:acyl-CoA dehydrogenase
MLDKSEAQKMNTLGAWELPEELQHLRDTVRRFMVNEVKPVEDKL